MTLDELLFIKDYVTVGSNVRPSNCKIRGCDRCKKEQKIYDLIERELALKTFDPNKNDKK